jgi:hypothetical protein
MGPTHPVWAVWNCEIQRESISDLLSATKAGISMGKITIIILKRSSFPLAIESSSETGQLCLYSNVATGFTTRLRFLAEES